MFKHTAALALALAAVPAPAVPASSSWIVGAWALDRRDCGAVAALTLRSDGTFFTDSEHGDWRLSGNRLTFIARETYTEGGDSTPVRNPRPTVSQVRSIGAGRMTIRAPNGSVSTMTRCR